MTRKQTLNDFYNHHRIIVIILGIFFVLFVIGFLASSVDTYKTGNCNLIFEVEYVSGECGTTCFGQCVGNGFPLDGNLPDDVEFEKLKDTCICKCAGCIEK